MSKTWYGVESVVLRRLFYFASLSNKKSAYSDIIFLLRNTGLTLSSKNNLSSAKVLVCFHYQSVPMLLKVGENVVRLSNSFDPGDMPSYSASHPEPSCLHMAPGLDWPAKG